MYLNQKLGVGSMLVLQRLVRFYNYLNVVSALVAGLSLAVMSYGEFHPSDSDLIPPAEGLLTSSAITSLISLMIATMLLFRFEGHETATVADLMVAWTPLVLLDVAIVENLLGTVLWYSSKNSAWRTALMSAQLGFLLMLASWIALWMFRTMSQRGGMGQEELRALATASRTADK